MHGLSHCYVPNRSAEMDIGAARATLHRMRKSLLVVVAAVALSILSGCGKAREPSPGNVSFDFDPAVVPLEYSFFPAVESSTFHNVDSGNSGNSCNFCNGIEIRDGTGALVLIGVLVGTAIVFYAADIAYHQVAGVSYLMVIDFGNNVRREVIVPGANHVALSDWEIDAINSRKAFIVIKAAGKYTGVMLVDSEIHDDVLRFKAMRRAEK